MKVHFYATLRDITGSKTVDFSFDHEVSAQDLLNAIIARFPGLRKELLDGEGRLHGFVHFFINGRDVKFLKDNLETKLTPADVINIFPAVGGG